MEKGIKAFMILWADEFGGNLTFLGEYRAGSKEEAMEEARKDSRAPSPSEKGSFQIIEVCPYCLGEGVVESEDIDGMAQIEGCPYCLGDCREGQEL